jgi:cell division protein FtsN
VTSDAPRSTRAPKARSHRLSPLEALPPVSPDETTTPATDDKPDTVIPPDPGSATNGRTFRVQVGRFDNQAAAERLKDVLTRAGYSPRVVTNRRSGAVQYRVQVGTFRQKENADRQMETLRSQSYDPYLSDNDQ